MKKFLTFLSILIAANLLVIAEADARRMGGGRSIGMQRNIAPTPRPPSQAAPAAPASAAAASQAGRSRWLGPIAGLAAGLGLAALFSHLGLGEGFGTFVMLMLLVAGALFLFRMFRRSSQKPSPLQYAGGVSGLDTAARPNPVDAVRTSAGSGGAHVGLVPSGFDADSFLRQAKVNFVRLQAAHDAGNLEDLREFTTPEMFAEIKLELQERGAAAQKTDVVVLNADLLDVSEKANQYVASVRFHGTIRELEGEAPSAFGETWHLTKPLDGSHGWQVAGIEQSA